MCWARKGAVALTLLVKSSPTEQVKAFIIDLFYTVSVSERRLLPVLKDRGQNRRTEG